MSFTLAPTINFYENENNVKYHNQERNKLGLTLFIKSKLYLVPRKN